MAQGDRQAQVETVKAHALEHYEAGGWDVIVECWSDVEIAEYLVAAGAFTPEDALKAFATLVSVWADQQADAASYREG